MGKANGEQNVRVCVEGMWLEEEDAGRSNDERRDEMSLVNQTYSMGLGFVQPARLVVGYALTSKKTKSFLQPKLQGLARNKGILFVAIDHDKPLSDQGPFDVVLHKLSGKDWGCVLENSIMYHDSIVEAEAI